MKIMVVDDDSIPRKVMIKILVPIGECVALDNGKDAVSMFDKATRDKKPFDLIILDISMPDMDGTQVLNIIRKKEKRMAVPKVQQVKIIMATASIRKSSIKKCIDLKCNGYISKPYNKQQVYKDLERLGLITSADIKKEEIIKKSYAGLVSKIIKRFNKGVIELPVLPHMVQEVQNLLKNSEPSIDDLAAIVGKDAVISSKLISIANSSLYKGVETVTTLNTALLRLGLKETLSIITTVTSKNLYNSKNESLKKLLNTLWLHSLACACYGKFLAKEVDDKGMEEEIFLMGIIHDIGKVLLLKAVADISPDEPFDDKGLQSAIQEVHTIFGAVLIKKWGFSKKYIEIAELHHWNKFPAGTQKELLIIHLSDYFCSEIGYASFKIKNRNNPKDNFNPQILVLLKQLNIDSAKVKEIGEKVKGTMKSLSDQF
ncbi:MAG: HDOD domain-containing protein [Pseudomonadota bacterium]